MAKINGLEIKFLRKMIDHEGCAMYSGKVYLNGTLLGEWSQDYMCGPAIYCFDTRLIEPIVERYAKSKYVKDEYRDIINADILLSELVELKEAESQYRYGLKHGYPYLYYVPYTSRYFHAIRPVDASNSKEYAELKLFCDRCKAKIICYSKLSDFNIKV